MIPRRLDRLPWSRWPLAGRRLRITWILDGFEVTLVGAIASMLTDPDALGLFTQQSASARTFYLVGAIFRRPPLRLPHRSLWPQEAVHGHARDLSFLDISKYVIRNYPQRGLLGLSLTTGQAFLYNAIFFTYTLVLTEFYGVSEKTRRCT
jgi:hypothetical protein